MQMGLHSLTPAADKGYSEVVQLLLKDAATRRDMVG